MWKKMPKERGERMRGNGKRDKYFIFLSHTVAYKCRKGTIYRERGVQHHLMGGGKNLS